MTILKNNKNQYDINHDIFTKLKILAGDQKNTMFETASINKMVPKNNQMYINTKNFRWFKYFFVKKPVNLLFSLDQFIFEFSKKQPQKRRSSEFQQQLKEQKKIALFYGNLSRKELTKIIEKVKQYQGYFYKNFFWLLERRLDLVLYRSGFAKTISLARQLITHKKILINNKIITTPSYLLKSGDCISVHPNFLESLSNNILLTSKKNISKNFKYDPNFSKLGIQTLFKKFHNIKNTKKSYKTVNSLIYLLLKKINSRAHIKLRKTQLEFTNFQFGTVNNYLTLIKYKPLISISSKYLLFSLKQNNYLLSEKKPFFFNSKNSLFLKEKQRKIFNKQQYKNQNKKSNSNFSNWKVKNSFYGTSSLKYSSKKNTMLLKKLILKTLFFMNFQIIFKNYFNSEIKKHCLKKRVFSQKFSFENQKIKFSKFGGLKPLHLEISYNILKIIFLYSPQRLNFPFYINIDLLSRAFK